MGDTLSDTPPGSLALPTATALLLEREYRYPVLTSYTLAILLFRLLSVGKYDGRPLRIRPRMVLSRDLYAVRQALLNRGIVKPDASLPASAMRLVDRSQSSADEVLCTLDPFGFLSHLSAMAYHGLTNRIPAVLFFTTLAPSKWQVAANDQMNRDLGDQRDSYREHTLPPLRRSRIEKIQGSTITTVFTQELGGYQIARNGALRVAKIGRTFLDMLRRPDLCGGMAHVMDIFQDHAPPYLPLLINEFNQHGTKIDRVRAGYLLEERSGIRDPKIDAWVVDAQRGGSRRLDPKGAYAPIFSERWKISINV